MNRFLTLSGLLVLVGFSGYLAGRLVTLEQASEPPFVLRPDTRPRVPVVEVLGIREGKVTGKMSGEIRFFWGEEMVIPDGSGAFRLAPDLLVEEIAVAVPDGMSFVASKNGKRYYPVGSPMGERIKPENRRYFRMAVEAEEAGFSR